jgi:N-acetylmuramoyl-L-alanine amidase
MASRGIETYFLNLATDEGAIMVAARENATSARNISDLEDILSDLMKNAKQDESSRLASYVQEAIIKKLSPQYGGVKNKGVKQAPFEPAVWGSQKQGGKTGALLCAHRR